MTQIETAFWHVWKTPNMLERMRSNMRVDEIPLTYSKPSVIQETRAHFDSLLRKAVDKEDDSNTTDHDRKFQSQVLSPVHSLTSGKEVQHPQSRKRKKKPCRNSKQNLIEPDNDLSLTDEDIITSNDEIYAHENISNDILVHCNPGFTSDSDFKESSNSQDNDNHKKITYTYINEKQVESNATKYDLPSTDSSLSRKSVLLISSLKTSDKELHGLRSSASSEEKSDNDHVSSDNEAYDHKRPMNEVSQPVPPPRTKKISGKAPFLQRLSRLSLNFSHSTLSSHISSEDSIQTAVHLSPTENPIEDQDSPKDEESFSKRRHKTQPKMSKENIELKPLTEMTPSYEEIDGSESPSRSAEGALRKSRRDKNKLPRKPTDYSIQSYDEIEEDSQNEVAPADSAPQDETKKLGSRRNENSNVSSAKLKRERKSAERFRYNSEEDEEQNANYNYDKVLGILIHHCDRLRVDSLIIHPVVRVHVIDIATGKYLKKSDKDRCYSYEEQSNIDFIQPISTQPCNFSALRSLTPTWEEMLVINEDIHYITSEGMNVIILFEISDFISFDMASLQYKKLGSEGGWHRIAWAFLKPVASNGSTNLNKRLRLQLFKPTPDRRAKSSSEKCDVYQHWLKGSRTRYPSTLHVSVLAVNPTNDLPSPHSTLHQDLGSIDVLSPTLGLAADKDHDSATEVPDQKSSKDDIDKTVIPPEVVSWSRIPGQTCKIPNEKSLTLPAGNLGCFCLRFSPCGKFLAADSANHNSHSLLIYRIPDGSLVKRFHGHQGLIYDLQWSKGSKFILSASADCTACVWDVETALVKMLPHPSFVYSASFFHEDDQALHVVTGCCDHVLRVWMRSDNHTDFQLVNEHRGHNGFITSICHDETGKFYSGDSEGKIRIWCCDGFDLSLLREVNIRELNGVTISRLVPHPGGQRLLIHTRDNTLRMINITTTSPIQWFNGALNHRLQTGATLSPCGRLVLSASEDGTFWIWNADTGKQLGVYSDIVRRAASQRSVLPLSGTVDYHPLEHMAAFSIYGKHAPIVVCVYTKNASGKSLGLQLMAANTKESPTLMPHDAICDSMKIRRKGSYLTRDDQRISTTKSPQSYAGSLASIIQQMDEVIALTRRSNHSSDGASKKPSLPKRTPAHHQNTPPPEHSENAEQRRNTAPPESSTFPELTQVLESRVSSQSSSSSTSIRRNPRDVLHAEHQIKRRHSGFGTWRESAGVNVEGTLQAGRSSSVVFAEVSPLTSTAEEAAGRLGDSIKSMENTPNKTKAFTHHVMSVSSISSDSDSHVIDLTEILS